MEKRIFLVGVVIGGLTALGYHLGKKSGSAVVLAIGGAFVGLMIAPAIGRAVIKDKKA